MMNTPTDIADLITYLAHHIQLMDVGNDVLRRCHPGRLPSAPHELDKIYGVALNIINCTAHFTIGEFDGSAMHLVNLIQAHALALYNCGFEAGHLAASVDTVVSNYEIDGCEADNHETE